MDIIEEISCIGDNIELKYSDLVNHKEFSKDAKIELEKMVNVDGDKLLSSLTESILNAANQHNPSHFFSDSRVTIYNSKNFVIEANIWQMAYTVIHEHKFSGAFKIMKGSAINNKYKFIEDATYESFDIGKLEKIESKYLIKGSVEEIKPKNEFIHKIVHLNNPTITLIIRTTCDIPEMKYQRAFHGNSIGINSSYFCNTIHQSSLILDVQTRLNNEKEYKNIYIGFISKLDLTQLIHLYCKQSRSHLLNGDVKIDVIQEMMKFNNPDLIEKIIGSIEYEKYTSEIFNKLRGLEKSSDCIAEIIIFYCCNNIFEMYKLYCLIMNVKLNYIEFCNEFINKINQSTNLLDSDEQSIIINKISSLKVPDIIEQIDLEELIEMNGDFYEKILIGT